MLKCSVSEISYGPGKKKVITGNKKYFMTKKRPENKVQEMQRYKVKSSVLPPMERHGSKQSLLYNAVSVSPSYGKGQFSKVHLTLLQGSAIILFIMQNKYLERQTSVIMQWNALLHQKPPYHCL